VGALAVRIESRPRVASGFRVKARRRGGVVNHGPDHDPRVASQCKVGHRVLRNAIRSFRSDGDSRSPKVCPGIDRVLPS